MVLSDIIIFLMVAGLLGGLIYVMASPNRYAKMTDEEFEEDTKRAGAGFCRHWHGASLAPSRSGFGDQGEIAGGKGRDTVWRSSPRENSRAHARKATELGEIFGANRQAAGGLANVFVVLGILQLRSHGSFAASSTSAP
jgi:hypothetical protein